MEDSPLNDDRLESGGGWVGRVGIKGVEVGLGGG